MIDKRVVAAMSGENKGLLDALAGRKGMKHHVLLGRMLTWLVAQDPALQDLILRDPGEGSAMDLVTVLYAHRRGIAVEQLLQQEIERTYAKPAKRRSVPRHRKADGRA